MPIDYGRGGSSPSVPATESVAPVAGVSSGLYTWDPSKQMAFVYNHPDSGVDVYVKWNDDACAKTGGAFDEVVEPGSRSRFPHRSGDAVIQKVAIWIDGAMVYGTNFVVNAFP